MSTAIDLEVVKERIREQKCFTNLNPAEVDVLATLLSEKKFNAGDVIVKQGAPVDAVYIIVNGNADVFKSDETHPNEELKVATLREGGAIGLSDYGFYSLTGLRTATVIANTEMLTLRLSVAIFRGFALAYPHANEVMRQQAERL